MQKTHKHSLQTFVRRTLILRLIVAGGTLAFLLGMAVLIYERGRVSDEAIEYVVGRTQLFFARYNQLLADPKKIDPAAIQSSLLEFRQSRQKVRIGDFAYVGIFDTALNPIVDFVANNYSHTEFGNKLPKDLKQTLSTKDTVREIITIDGRPHLKIFLPLTSNAGETVAYESALFAFSPEAIWDFRFRGIRTMLGAMAVVLLTTTVLFPVILKLTRRIAEFSVMLLDANLETLETLGNAIAQRDSDTNAHNYRVTIYATRLGEAIGLSAQTMRTLIKGSFLHDVGKIGIPDHILLKPGKLDEEEFEVMKLHVDHGQAIIKRSKWLQDALEVVSFHHEKLEGRGYPNGIAGDEIPITARIFAIADVFDALTSKRPYKEPWPFKQAMTIMEEGKGAHFDSAMIDAFICIAEPLFDQFGGKDEVPRDELREIIEKYFTEEVESLEY
jgi:HD-GYP domain-containing protein (c-di-GMP phosphodiesterase class II)